MKTKFVHILLSLVLTFLVSDYLWIELIKDENIVIELEGSEGKEEIREFKSSGEGKQHPLFPGSFLLPESQYLFNNPLLHVADFSLPSAKAPAAKVKRYLLFHQLRIPC